LKAKSLLELCFLRKIKRFVGWSKTFITEPPEITLSKVIVCGIENEHLTRWVYSYFFK
jgi:hypothetical protein